MSWIGEERRGRTGSVTLLTPPHVPLCLPPPSAAPTLLQPYSQLADVWSAGVLLYQLVTGERPFRGSSIPAIAVKILRGTYAPLPDSCNPYLRQLVATLLRRRPEHRPTVDEARWGD